MAVCGARPYTKPDSTILIWSTADLGDITAQATLIDRSILYNSLDYYEMQSKIGEREGQIMLDHEIRNGRKTLKAYMLEEYRNGNHHLASLVRSVNAKMAELELPGSALYLYDINRWLEDSGYDTLPTNVDIVYNFLKEEGPKRTRQITITLSKRFPQFSADQRSSALTGLKQRGLIRQDRKKFWHCI